MQTKMDAETIQLAAFSIILFSGNARTKIHEAFKHMRVGEFMQVEVLLAEANEEIIQAHQAQTKLLQEYAAGVQIEMEIIMVHAQDHLMTTLTMQELAAEFSYLHEQNHQLLTKLTAQA